MASSVRIASAAAGTIAWQGSATVHRRAPETMKIAYPGAALRMPLRMCPPIQSHHPSPRRRPRQAMAGWLAGFRAVSPCRVRSDCGMKMSLFLGEHRKHAKPRGPHQIEQRSPDIRSRCACASGANLPSALSLSRWWFAGVVSARRRWTSAGRRGRHAEPGQHRFRRLSTAITVEGKSVAQCRGQLGIQRPA